MTPNCARCKKPFDEPGGLLFSPPADDLVAKYHLCPDCFIIVLAQVEGASEE